MTPIGPIDGDKLKEYLEFHIKDYARLAESHTKMEDIRRKNECVEQELTHKHFLRVIESGRFSLPQPSQDKCRKCGNPEGYPDFSRDMDWPGYYCGKCGEPEREFPKPKEPRKWKPDAIAALLDDFPRTFKDQGARDVIEAELRSLITKREKKAFKYAAYMCGRVISFPLMWRDYRKESK